MDGIATLKISRDQVVWQGDEFIIYRDPEKGLMRYLPQFKASWPVTFVTNVTEIDAQKIWDDL